MSGNYAKSLSKNADRGILGTPEVFLQYCALIYVKITFLFLDFRST